MTAGFDHRALVYERDEDFLAGTLPYIRDGFVGDGAVMVAVGPRHRALLEDQLGDEADLVEFVAMREIGRNPARIVPAWADFLGRHPSSRPLRGIGEPVWPGRADHEIVECEHHEALLDFAFAGGRSWSLLCPYDESGLPADVIERARHGHRGEVRTPTFIDEALPAPPSEHRLWQHVAGDRLFRAEISTAARSFGLSRPKVEDLVLATQEVVTNSVRYGGGSATVRLWGEATGVVVDVEDEGMMVDPLVGRRRPDPAQIGGRGLWIANQICDLVQIRTGPGATRVRLHVGEDGIG